MGQLVLVRHGQASFFEEDYDKLSTMGEDQARELARHWLKYAVKFDEAFSGTLKRQVRTAEVVREVYTEAGVEFPAFEQKPEFNEYDGDSSMRVLLPELLSKDPEVKRLNDDLQAAQDRKQKYRAFHLLLEAVMAVWVSGDYESSGFESWKEFSSRVYKGLADVTEGRSGGKRIAVFTSGGVIGTTVSHIMKSPDMMALELNWRVHNSSVSEIAFSKGRYTLSTFNNIAHLQDPKFWTYR